MSTPINADTARNLTRQNLKGPVIQPWMDYIYDVIRWAAKEGRFSVTHVFTDRRLQVGRSAPDYPTSEMQTAIRKQLEAEGFTWKEHPDPDPGYPGSGPYNELSWKE